MTMVQTEPRPEQAAARLRNLSYVSGVLVVSDRIEELHVEIEASDIPPAVMQILAECDMSLRTATPQGSYLKIEAY